MTSRNRPEPSPQAEAVFSTLEALPTDGASQDDVARVMDGLPAVERDASHVYEALRRRYRGRVPVLQAMVWLMEQPGYRDHAGHPELHRNLVSGVLLKHRPEANAVLLDRIGDDVLAIAATTFGPTLAIVIGHAVDAMREQGEDALAGRLETLRAGAIERRSAMLRDWLPARLAELDAAAKSDWRVDDAFKASWVLSGGLEQAEPAITADLLAAAETAADAFARAALVNAVSQLAANGTIADVARAQAMIEAAIGDPDDRMAELGLHAAASLIEAPSARCDEDGVEAAVAAYRAAGRPDLDILADIDELLEDG